MTDDEARSSALALIPGGSAPLALSEVESYLARAADLLRGAIDQADFKAYIFPLMFFKRISDVFIEEYGQALAASGDDHAYASFAENHRFQIPEGCLWSDVRKRTQNVGQALTNAFREIEKANPDTLYGIFGNASWTNKQKLPDAALIELIEHFSTKELTNACVSPDVFGQAYEYLIKRFADQSSKKAGEYYTPRSVVRLLVNILDPKDGEKVYDPACGTGGMLLEVIQHVKDVGGRPESLLGKLYGQEKNLTTSAIARMNMLLHGVEDFSIVRGDTLNHPAFFADDKLARFECVLANPPFSLEEWGAEAWGSDRWGRNALGGVAPKSNGDWAWVQHMIASMAPKTGRIAVVLPQGALFRGRAEARIRSAVLEKDLVEAVIGLGPNLFYGAGLAASVLILRAKKPEARKNKVLFIDASTLFKRGRNQNTLEAEHSRQILDLYHGFADVPGLSAVAPLEAVKTNKGNLNIPLYVAPVEEEPLSLDEARAALAAAHERAKTTRAQLLDQLKEWGFAS
jgi:type I restriction system adenine methylase HsdM